jgi:hypothetical protein
LGVFGIFQKICGKREEKVAKIKLKFYFIEEFQEFSRNS